MREVKDLRWRVTFFVLSLAYLVPEMIFNAKLVSIVGSGSISTHVLEQLEIFGRAVSGIGVTLLIADILPARFYRSVSNGIVTLLLTLLITWPTVFYGQKWLVDTFLINPSTVTERQHAVFSRLLRDALAFEAVEINELEYKASNADSPEEMAFLAVFGGLLYADDTLAQNLESQRRAILHQYIQRRAYANFAQHYSDFNTLYDELSASYKEYVAGSNQYNQALANIPQQEAEYWASVETEVNQGWEKYQKAQRSFIARAEARAEKYGRQIYDYFNAVERCSKVKNDQRKSRCIERALERYETTILKAGLGYIEPNYWLISEQVSAWENALGTIVTGFLTGGLSTAMQGLDLATGGDGGMKDVRYKYTKDQKHYQNRFYHHPVFQQQIEKESGYPSGIATLSEFRQHGKTQEKLREKLKNKDLVLPNDWTITQRATFSKAVEKRVFDLATAKWQKNTAKMGVSLPTNLQWSAFQLHPSIQQKIEQRMGEMYVPNVRAEWNQVDFKIYVLDVYIDKQTTKYLALLDASEKQFADGGDYALQSKDALRSVIVPPISMFLSLFLICMTILKIPFKSIEIIQPHWSDNSLPKKVLSKYLPVFMLLILPVQLIGNEFTQEAKSPVNFFLNKVEQASSPVFSYALRWTLHMQPVLHPLGDSLEKATHLYARSEAITSGLAKELAMAHHKTAEKRKINSTFNLVIKTQPENATIRVMNIGPKYKPGMTLRNGAYEIQVSADGYQDYRKWHRFDSRSKALSIKLERQ